MVKYQPNRRKDAPIFILHSAIVLVPKLCLSAYAFNASALNAYLVRHVGEGEPPGQAFPGRAWEREKNASVSCQ